MTKKPQKIKNELYSSFKILIIAIPIVVLIGLAFSTFYTISIPSGQSMEPDIYAGDIVLLENVNTIDNVNTGDVIKFNLECDIDNTVIHTVKYETDEGLITKGENNDYIDQMLDEHNKPVDGACRPPITDDNIEGKVIYTTESNTLKTILTEMYYILN